MDYILLSAIMPILLLTILVTYDVICQWEINFKERMKAFPPEMRIPDHVTIDTGIPKFHAPGHKQSCQTAYSLNVKPGVGRTDGEGIERNWSELNPIANSIKEMGPGSYRDTLDDHIHYRNFRKYISMGMFVHSLWCKLILGSRCHPPKTIAVSYSREKPPSKEFR
jgi:hypothetical protein